MKATIESTAQFVEVSAPAGAPRTQARVWVGKTEAGIPIQLLILRVAVENAHSQEDFLRELAVAPAPAPEPLAFPLRMIL